MIKVTNLNKTFDINSSNKIKAVDNISITLPDTGLVALFGKSGSGKSTLLNSIGGLDKFDSGQIQVEEFDIKRYNPKQTDEMRNKYIGYIFQSYNLLEDCTVFDNVKKALDVVGLKNKEEVSKRVDEALRSVSMLQYKRRDIKALSGGQQQRVAIARALVKTPKIIIADEPTGNLDDKNTIAVMDILKQISQNCLVILVTHEPKLVEFYADYIVEMQDGKVINEKVAKETRRLEYKNSRNIYLKDMKLKSGNFENSEINLFTESENFPEVKLNIVFREGELYLKADADNIKINLLDKNSEIQFLDESYQKRDIGDDGNTAFINESVLKPIEKKDISKSVTWLESTKEAGKFILMRKNTFNRIAMVILFFMGLASVVLSGFISGAIFVNKNEYIESHEKAVTVSIKNSSDYNKLIADKNVEHILLNSSENYTATANTAKIDLSIIEYNKRQNTINVPVAPISLAKKSHLKKGKMPEKINEILLTQNLIDEYYDYTKANYIKIPDIIGRRVTFPNMNMVMEFVVVGVLNYDYSMVFIPNETLVYSNSQNISNRGTEKITLNDSVMPNDNVSISVPILSASMAELMYNIEVPNLGISDYFVLDSNNYEKNYIPSLNCVGTKKFAIWNNVSAVCIVADQNFSAQKLYDILGDDAIVSKNAIVFLKDKSAGITSLQNIGFAVNDPYESAITSSKENMAMLVSIFGVLSLICLAVMFIILYMLFRSSMIKKIKEIGVLRAIGIRKKDIIKQHFVQVGLFTVLTSFLGYFIGLIIFKNLLPIPEFNLNFLTVLVSLVILFVSNMLFGLSPIINLLKKTPSEILSKYDI